MAEATCDGCGGDAHNGYCKSCGLAVARSGDGSAALAVLGAPFRTLKSSFPFLLAPSRAAAAVKAGELTLASCIAVYLAWAALAFLVRSAMPASEARDGPYMQLVSMLGGDLPLVGEIVVFGIWAFMFALGYLPGHLMLQVWKGPTTHFIDAFALYLLFGGPFFLVRAGLGSSAPFWLSLIVFIPLLYALARLYGVPTLAIVAYFLLITIIANAFATYAVF